MRFRDFLSHPLSSARSWLVSHERFIAVNVSWTLAILFAIISLVYLFKSLRLI